MSKFGSAFKTARKSGAKEFKFGGKSYNTKLKEEAPKAKAKTASKSSVNSGPAKMPFAGTKSKPGAIKAGLDTSSSPKKRSAFSPTQDRGASGVAAITKPSSGPSTRGYGGPARLVPSKKMIAAGTKPKASSSTGFRGAMKKVANSIKMEY